MKKYYKYILIILLIIVVVSLIVPIFLVKKETRYTRPDYDEVATIYHSEMIGVDAGEEYTYSIYLSEDKNYYFYIVSESKITITGVGEAKDISSGSINSIKDLKKIKNSIKKHTSTEKETKVLYTYNDNGTVIKYENIEDLGKRLFK